MEHLRTSEDERQRVVTFLRDCCAEGYLDIDELDERQSGVLLSRTRGELVSLVSDMPGALEVLPGGAVARPTFVKPPRGRVAPVMLAVLTLLAVMVLVSVPVFELLMLGGFVIVLGIFALVVFVCLSPWLAAGALVAWSVNRLRQRPASPPRLH